MEFEICIALFRIKDDAAKIFNTPSFEIGSEDSTCPELNSVARLLILRARAYTFQKFIRNKLRICVGQMRNQHC